MCRHKGHTDTTTHGRDVVTAHHGAPRTRPPRRRNHPGTPTPWYKARSKPALPPSAYYAQRSPSGGGRGHVPPLIVKRCRVLGLRVGRWLCVLCRLVFYCSCACSCSWCRVAVVACVCSSGCVPTSWSGGVVLGWSCRSRRVLGASRAGAGCPCARGSDVLSLGGGVGSVGSVECVGSGGSASAVAADSNACPVPAGAWAVVAGCRGPRPGPPVLTHQGPSRCSTCVPRATCVGPRYPTFRWDTGDRGGGSAGIRTQGGYEPHRLSRSAPSAARTRYLDGLGYTPCPGPPKPSDLRPQSLC